MSKKVMLTLVFFPCYYDCTRIHFNHAYLTSPIRFLALHIELDLLRNYNSLVNTLVPPRACSLLLKLDTDSPSLVKTTSPYSR